MMNPLYPLARPIRFADIKPDHIRPAVDAAISDVKVRMANIVNGSVDDFIGALDVMTLPISEVMTVVSHLEGTMTSDALRKAYGEVQSDVSAFCTSISLDPDLWKAIKNYSTTPEALALEGPRKRFLAQTVDEFQNGGADLPDAKKKRLEAINIELAELCLKFSQNSLDSSNDWEMYVGKGELEGVPESAREEMYQEAQKANKTGFRVTLKAPCYSPIMQYADNRALRKLIYLASNAKGTSGKWDNRPLIRQILKLRRELAELLGFENFAEYVLHDRMAKNGTSARNLLTDLQRHSEPGFHQEALDLQEFRDKYDQNVDRKWKEAEINTLGTLAQATPSGDVLGRMSLEARQAELIASRSHSEPLEMWDLSYYAEKMRKEKFSFDAEEMREYFPYEAVLKGAFALAEKLYGVRIVQWIGMQTWHKDVSGYRLYSSDGLDMGGFYVDPFPRESKSEGAWMLGLVDGVGELPFAGICMNFTPAQGDHPSLLRHYEVETLFHEFGHLLHHMMSRTELHSHFGTAVAWDFVELPSQVMENWTWDWNCLQTFARHYKTGELLPRELFDKMRSTKHFRAATHLMQFTGYSSMDLMLHMDYDPNSSLDPVAVSRGFLQRFVPAELPASGQRIASFTHIFGDPTGYAAGYYSYQWAEVLDADAFSKFQEMGLGREAGVHFLNTLLSRGDEEDAVQLFRDFMGRDPDLKAFLARYGL